jgi:acetylornithine deacetylase/succinyl-diaminopimelate desuccinylase-like protein
MRSLTTTDLVNRLMSTTWDDLARLVSFRSVADPLQAPPYECDRTARYLVAAFCQLGVRSRLYQTGDGSWAVVGTAPAPPGAPTVMVSCHYDVDAAGAESLWRSPPFRLTDRDGRWYGRGSADGKGDVVAVLSALRILGGGDYPVGVTVLAGGSHRQGTGGMESFVPARAELLHADAIIVCGCGNVAAGVPTLTTALRGYTAVDVTVDSLAGGAPSGTLGGAAPDALSALVRMLATLHDEQGNTAVRELDAGQRWTGAHYSDDRYRRDCGLLDGVDLLGDGTVADMLWARPALTILGIDCPPVLGSAPQLQPRARARLELRVPPGVPAADACEGLAAHLAAAAPWHVRVDVAAVASEEPFQASTDGPAYQAMATAMADAYGLPPTAAGQGGSIPLCTVLRDTFPAAEIMIMGVADPASQVHAPDESVDPAELERMALAQARFMQLYSTLNRY